MYKCIICLTLTLYTFDASDIHIQHTLPQAGGWTRLKAICKLRLSEEMPKATFNISFNKETRDFMSEQVTVVYTSGNTYVVENVRPIKSNKIITNFEVLYKGSAAPTGTCSYRSLTHPYYKRFKRGVVNTTTVTRTLPPLVSQRVTYSVLSAFRDSNGTTVSTATVHDVLMWTIDIPDEYLLLPVICTAYAGADKTGHPSKAIIVNGCTEDDSLVEDFDSVLKTSYDIPNIKRYYTDFYVFKFYNNHIVFIECLLKVCPPPSQNCNITCGQKKRRSTDTDHDDDSRVTYTRTTSVIRVRDNHLLGNAHRLAPTVYSNVSWLFLILICSLLQYCHL